jgi:DNA-binding MarR family transcriptional regulator
MKEVKAEHIDKLDHVMHIFYRRMNSLGEEMDIHQTQGATPIEISILGMVGKNPDIILKDIIDMLQIPGSTLTNAVDRLEKRSFLNRVISKRDRRSYGLSLTDEGRKVYLKHQKTEQLLWDKILSTLDSDEEIELFLHLIEKVTKEIK